MVDAIHTLFTRPDRWNQDTQQLCIELTRVFKQSLKVSVNGWLFIANSDVTFYFF